MATLIERMSEVVQAIAADIKTIFANGFVTNTRMASMSPKTYKGRTAGTAGVPQDLTVAQMQADLGIVAGVPSNLALGTRTDTTQPITNSDGTGFTLPTATTSLAGLLSGALKTAYDAVVTWVNTNGANVLAHLGLTNNPHSVTKAQVGLSNVPNTDFTSAVNLNTAKVTNASHSGDVTGATALTIANSVVTNAKLASMATKTFKGRTSASTGAVEDLTVAQMKADLGINVIYKATTTLSYSNVTSNASKDVTVTGASVGDIVCVDDNIRWLDTINNFYIISAKVTSTNTVRIYIHTVILYPGTSDASLSLFSVKPPETPGSPAWTVQFAVIKA